MFPTSYTLNSIGVVRSELTRREEAPRQGYEGAPDAWLEIDPAVAEGLDGIAVGDEIIVITWLHQSERNILKVHPGRNKDLPLTGVFATRSPNRPNPLGLHRVVVHEIVGSKMKVGPLEALDGTPVVDIKSILRQSADS
ncbi:tRNA (N6-threonylcarbamoyladenosine(37)-N6)-methyltransferase TrmO [Pelotalea chapellei]|uniref:tRNA (N6-threonylcarbamoyladenosine(37)-N6)-methyltransferase TrmO n=1 Tax=Pelotalea chapellei TaxID=44671 RepID=A0ABS5UBC7_9BACT|nr:tRNA (N6-threonylcarbamoyladenosine(37)-N6)-methyltransferase TrmO [Pelotalea chapellei]MBT1072980.1 tRNA (N6-threonylcarbamoyladenosine(37)-N6)-methyltransferase TrmO [Pelotalea chapellei]